MRVRSLVAPVLLCAACMPPVHLHLLPETPRPAALTLSDEETNADAVVLSETESVRLEMVGMGQPATVTETHRMIYIVNDRGLAYADLQIPYQFADLSQGFKARTIAPDGTVTDVQASDLINVSLTSLHGGGAARVQMVTLAFPNAEPGAIVEYVFQNVSMGWDMWGRYIASWDIPVRSSTYQVTVPRGWELATSAHGYESHVEGETYVFSAQNIPAWSIEPLSPPGRTTGVWAAYTAKRVGGTNVFTNWPEVAQNYWNNALAIAYRGPGWSKPEGDVDAAITSLWQRTQRQIYDRAPLFGAGQRWAKNILDDGLGTANERALVMFAALREWDIDAQLLMVPSSGNLDPTDDFPTPERLDELLLRVPRDNAEAILLDPTCLGCQAGELAEAHQDRAALIIADKNSPYAKGFTSDASASVATKLIRLPLASHRTAAKSIEVNFALSRRGLLATAGQWQLTGEDAAGIRYYFAEHPLTEAKRKELLRRRYLDGIEDGAVELHGVDEKGAPLSITVENVLWERGGYTEAGDWVQVSLAGVFPERWMDAVKAGRKEPVYFDATPQYERRARFHVPEAHTLVALPKQHTLESPFGTYTIEAKRKGKDTVVLHERLELAQRIVGLEKMKEFAAFIGDVKRARAEPLVLRGERRHRYGGDE